MKKSYKQHEDKYLHYVYKLAHNFTKSSSFAESIVTHVFGELYPLSDLLNDKYIKVWIYEKTKIYSMILINKYSFSYFNFKNDGDRMLSYLYRRSALYHNIFLLVLCKAKIADIASIYKADEKLIKQLIIETRIWIKEEYPKITDK